MPIQTEMVMNVANTDDDPVELRFQLDTENKFHFILDDEELGSCAYSTLDFDNTTTLVSDLNQFIRRAP